MIPLDFESSCPHERHPESGLRQKKQDGEGIIGRGTLIRHQQHELNKERHEIQPGMLQIERRVPTKKAPSSVVKCCDFLTLQQQLLLLLLNVQGITTEHNAWAEPQEEHVQHFPDNYTNSSEDRISPPEEAG
jgi:hypothetical protein